MTLIERAGQLFRAYHGYAPTQKADIVKLEFPDPAVGVYIGEIVEIRYKTKEHRSVWYHPFGAHARPRLYVSADGQQAYIYLGRYRFTARGFIG